MRKIVMLMVAALIAVPNVYSQKKAKKAEKKPEGYIFTTVKENPVTSVKNQSSSSTCWAFSTISFLESEAIKAGAADTSLNLSEMFVVSNAYSDKAEKYNRLDGNLNFAPGSDFGDVICVFRKYGIVPENEMLGLNYGQNVHKHAELDAVTKSYMETIIKKPLKVSSTAWKRGFDAIVAAYLGEKPEKFVVNGKEYTPKSYEESLGLNLDDYVSLTSFTHHPFYEKFAIEVPDNWRWTESYNLPIDELEQVMDYAVNNGYTLAWGADVSEKGFTRNGLGVVPDITVNANAAGSDQQKWVGSKVINFGDDNSFAETPGKEMEITQEMRQVGFDEGTTTDDHGMHIYGIAKDQNGTKYYMVKNSWGTAGKYNGIWYVSVPYVKYKTMNILINKNAIPSDIKAKLNIK